MELHKEYTKRHVAAAFKELLVQHPFEKISILMITDRAGIRRPSFYYYFQDKYDLLEWILYEEVIESTRKPLEKGLLDEAIDTFFSRLYADAAFYRKAFEVTGQNGFEDAFRRLLRELFLSCMSEKAKEQFPVGLPADSAAMYHSICITAVVKNWLSAKRPVPVEQIIESYHFLCTTSLLDMF